MIYCGFCDYIARFPEGELARLSREQYEHLARRASRLIDRETMGRAAACAGLLREELELACAMTAELLFRREALIRSHQGGAVLSASTDGYSESYAAPGELDRALRLELEHILRQCLGADPQGLLCRWLP